jgi:hypothetical protein
MFCVEKSLLPIEALLVVLIYVRNKRLLWQWRHKFNFEPPLFFCLLFPRAE